MDDDSLLQSSLEDVVGAQDQMILAQEGTKYRDKCYKQEYHLSSANITNTHHVDLEQV